MTDELRKETENLTANVEACRKTLIAIGDETRQHTFPLSPGTRRTLSITAMPNGKERVEKARREGLGSLPLILFGRRFVLQRFFSTSCQLALPRISAFSPKNTAPASSSSVS